MNSPLDRLISSYQLESPDTKINPLGHGLINETFLVATPDTKFVLQKLNTNVFPEPTVVNNNFLVICQQLSLQASNGNYSLAIPELQKNTEQSYLTKDGNNYWRLITFVENSKTIDQLESPQQAFVTAQSFAQFSAALSAMDAKTLTPVIDNFHNIAFRKQQLDQAVSLNKANRKQECQPLLALIDQQAAFIEQIKTLEQKLPIRVTHNDTKISNLLFSEVNSEPIAVIDLDTCMPGFLMHDFGDMVRTCCSNLAEDDTKLEQMTFKLDIFQALLAGYLQPLHLTMTTDELESLLLGARLLPFMIGIRFLTDYLNGDTYFKCQYGQHNLHRAQNQFKLFELVNQHEAEIKDMLERELSKFEAKSEGAEVKN